MQSNCMRNLERARCWAEVGCWCVTIFSLLGLLVAKAVKSSPCARKVGRNQRFGACRESFVPGGPPSRAAGRVLYRVGRRAGRLGEFCLAESQMWLAQGLSHVHRRPAHRRRCHALPLHVCPVFMPNRPVETASRIRSLCVHRSTQTARPRIVRGRAATQASAGISTQRERPNGT